MKKTAIYTLLLTVITGACSLPGYGTGTPHDNDLKKAALTVLENKCNVCHRSNNPGKVFTPDNMEGLAPRIYKQVFVKKRMPKGNKVKLTEGEEQLLKNWLETEL